jgi:hypothetical protein
MPTHTVFKDSNGDEVPIENVKEVCDRISVRLGNDPNDEFSIFNILTFLTATSGDSSIEDFISREKGETTMREVLNALHGELNITNVVVIHRR